MSITPEQERDLGRIVGEVCGSVSTCWTDLSSAGRFDSERADVFVTERLAEIVDLLGGVAKAPTPVVVANDTPDPSEGRTATEGPDWVTDATMSTEETLARFDALNPQPAHGPTPDPDSAVPGTIEEFDDEPAEVIPALVDANRDRRRFTPETLTVIVHRIATDGLPDMDADEYALIGRVVLVFDGNVVSGWPLDVDETYGQLWEGDTDVSHGRPLAGVTHWLEFPRPIHTIR